MVDEKSSEYDQKLMNAVKKEIVDGSQIFLDYDGTLVPIVINPEECYADTDLRNLLARISKKYQLFIVSGRQISELREFIGIDVNIIGMHGAISYIKGKEVPLVSDFYQYQEKVRKIAEMHLEKQFQGLRVYNKSSGILLHLGLVDNILREKISERVNELGQESGMDIYRGKDVLELKIPNVNKGDAIRKFRDQTKCLIAGDEQTDEMAFRECSECVTIHVGKGPTAARYTVPDVYSFRRILETLVR
jgi:trehalose 6-phosphate phosphatase